MSRFRFDDDFFSPVRFDISAVDESTHTSEGSLNDSSYTNEFSVSNADENKITLKESVLTPEQKNELKSKDGNVKKLESGNICTPIIKKNSSDKSVAKRHSAKLKLEKNKCKTISVRKEHVESYENNLELCRKNILDFQIPTCDVSDVRNQISTTASLTFKKENTTLKVVKKKQKDFNQSSKCDFVDEVKKLRTDNQSVRKKISENSPNLPEDVSNIKYKDSSVMSTESKENISENKKSSYSSIQKEKPVTANQLRSIYEESIEKMVRSCINSESTKIRQHMYMQQMSFYREMNKIKDKMEKQHLVTTERLFKIIEELMQMNASLKFAFADKD